MLIAFSAIDRIVSQFYNNDRFVLPDREVKVLIEMRVIAGSAKSLQLVTPDGDQTRPTTDKIKETLFNMLNPYLADAVFLDLFAGSGSIGIEALSRGAREAVFVEKKPKAIACIKKNLAHTHLSERAQLLTCDVRKALQELNGKMTFDIIFMDPPYADGAEKWVLEYLSDSSLLKPGGQIIVEAAKETSFAYASELGFRIMKTKEYRSNKHVFLEPERRQDSC